MVCKMGERSVLSGVVQPVARWMGQRLFLAAYEASNTAHWRYYSAQAGWQDLGGILEFSTEFLVTREKGELVYLMAFRADPERPLRRVTISVKARKSGVIHQEYIRIEGLDGMPVRKALTAIPLNRQPGSEIYGHRSGHLYIRLVEAVDADGVDLVSGDRVSVRVRPVCVDAGNHLYALRWGQYWNVDAIDLQKNALKSYWFRRTVKSAGRLWRPLRFRRALFRLLTNDVSLSVAFWSKNLFDASGLRESLPTEARAETASAHSPALPCAGAV